jgi:hypothetical protein
MPASTPCKTPGRGIMLGLRAATNAAAPSINPKGDSGANKIENMTLHRGTRVKAQPHVIVATAEGGEAYTALEMQRRF